MTVLKEFAVYIRKNRKEDVIQRMASMVQSIDEKIDFSILPATEVTQFLQDHLFLVLNTLEGQNVQEVLKDRIAIWLHQPEMQNTQVHHAANKLISFSYFFKIAFVECIAGFTSEVSIAAKIMIELENLHQQFHRMWFKAFETMGSILQSQLQKSEERYKDLFDNAHDLIHFVAPDGKIMYVNKAWQKALQYSIEEILQSTIYDFVAESDLQEFTGYRKKLVDQLTEEKQIKLHLKTKSAGSVFVEGFISAKINDGKVEYTRGIFRDISARVDNEKKLTLINEQLSEREENLGQLVTYAPDAIIAINKESLITYWNPKAEEIFGWSSEEVMSRSLTEIIIPEMYREAHEKGMKRYLDTGEAHVLNKTIEITALNKKGDEFYISLTISKSKQGGKIGFISFIRDITQHKKNTLELERKRKELEESNRELEQYAWLTSHDLGEPLRKILTFSDIVLTMHKEELTETVEKNIRKIYEAGKRMGSMIKSILLYSGLTSEQHLFEKVDLNLIIKEVLVDLELLINDANAIVEVSELGTIEAIPFQMRQLFLNLIGNAIKYKQSDIHPYIRLSASQNNGFLEIEVKDNGIGFDAKDKDKIFKLFQRLSITHQTDGTGIGLALCKKIVEKHNGLLNVESQPGIGTIFFISLPLQRPLL